MSTAMKNSHALERLRRRGRVFRARKEEPKGYEDNCARDDGQGAVSEDVAKTRFRPSAEEAQEARKGGGARADNIEGEDLQEGQLGRGGADELTLL
jgi:hypothetical protein